MNLAMNVANKEIVRASYCADIQRTPSDLRNQLTYLCRFQLEHLVVYIGDLQRKNQRDLYFLYSA